MPRSPAPFPRLRLQDRGLVFALGNSSTGLAFLLPIARLMLDAAWFAWPLRFFGLLRRRAEGLRPAPATRG